jgi:hypothetical protein
MRLALAASLALLAGTRGPLAAEPQPYTPEQVKAVVERYVERRSREGGGVFRIDDVDGRTLMLEFVDVGVVGPAALWSVHDPSGKQASGYAACVRFHPAGAPVESRYDVDLSVEPRDGVLTVTDVRIHKRTQLENGKWVWKDRAPAAAAH